MTKIYKALAFSATGKYINHGINLASVIVVARLLSPAELGVFAIASAITLVVAEIKSFGVGGYLIRSREIDKTLVQQSLAMFAIASWTAGILILLLTPSIAKFYNNRDIAPLLYYLSVGFFLAPYIGVGKSLMARYLNFGGHLAIDICSQLVQLTSVIYFIKTGNGYFSLAYANALGQITELIVVVLISPPLFTFRMRFRGIKKLFTFGAFVTGASVLRRISLSIPELIIGKARSSADVAFFSRGFGFLTFLQMLISSGIQPVVTPYLSLKQNTGEPIKKFYLHASGLMSGLLIPVMAVAAYSAETTIAFFFGDQWGASAQLVSILCVWGILKSLHSFSISYFLIMNLEKSLFIKELIVAIVTVVFCGAAASLSLPAVAWAIVATAIIEFLVTYMILQKHADLHFFDLVSTHMKSVGVGLICLAWAAVLDRFWPLAEQNVYLALPVLGSTTVLVWIASIFAIRHGLSKELVHGLTLFGFFRAAPVRTAKKSSKSL